MKILLSTLLVISIFSGNLASHAFASGFSDTSSYTEWNKLLKILTDLRDSLRLSELTESRPVLQQSTTTISTATTTVQITPQAFGVGTAREQPLVRILPDSLIGSTTNETEVFLNQKKVNRYDADGFYHAQGSDLTTSAAVGNLKSYNYIYTVSVQGNGRPAALKTWLNTKYLMFRIPDDLRTDTNVAYKSSRSELHLSQEMQRGELYYVDFDVFIDGTSDLSASTSSDNRRIIYQLVEHSLGLPPVLSINLGSDNNFSVVTRNYLTSYRPLVSFPADKGRWHNFKLLFRYGSNELYVWHNDGLVFDSNTAPFSVRKKLVLTWCHTYTSRRSATLRQICSNYDNQASTKIGLYRQIGSFKDNILYFKDISLSHLE